ncbi:MAG: PAAR domain-containing protein [Paracoccaceae bacterium]|nr:MAG: PAAR domain-containing protein [Paracoccaceae bacterium]
MAGPPQARLTDTHICPLTLGAPTPVIPPCAPPVLVVKLFAARLTDMCVTAVAPPPHPIAKGSATVMIQKLPAARIGMDLCSGGGAILPMQFTVYTGG